MKAIESEREMVSEIAPEGVEIDSFAPSSALLDERQSLIVASYNIRYAVGSFLITGSLGRRLGLTLPRRRPRLVARHLEKAVHAFSDGQRLPPADIVALQETDKRTRRAGGHDIARELAKELQMNYARAGLQTPRVEEPKTKQWYLDFEEHIPASDTGDTGVAILSRLPFADVARVDLPWNECAWRPRLALAATIQNGERPIHIFNAHIDPHAAIEGQLEQHVAILKRVEELAGPIILLGDFNTLSKRSCLEMRRLLESKGFVTPFKTGT